MGKEVERKDLVKGDAWRALAEGMIHTNGRRFGGYGFYLLKGKLVFVWNLLDVRRVRWKGA